MAKIPRFDFGTSPYERAREVVEEQSAGHLDRIDLSNEVGHGRVW
jgi:hypothetical protein